MLHIHSVGQSQESSTGTKRKREREKQHNEVILGTRPATYTFEGITKYLLSKFPLINLLSVRGTYQSKKVILVSSCFYQLDYLKKLPS